MTKKVIALVLVGFFQTGAVQAAVKPPSEPIIDAVVHCTVPTIPNGWNHEYCQ